MRWKELPINKAYLVSDHGDIKGKDGRLLKQANDTRGYKFVNIYNNTKPFHLSIHRAVAMCFIPNHNNYPQVNHLDEDKTNNHYTNLEWCDNKQNFDHSHSKPVLMIDRHTGEILKRFNAIRDVDVFFNKNAHQSVSKICCGVKRYNTAYGYKWRFEE